MAHNICDGCLVNKDSPSKWALFFWKMVVVKWVRGMATEISLSKHQLELESFPKSNSLEPDHLLGLEVHS